MLPPASDYISDRTYLLLQFGCVEMSFPRLDHSVVDLFYFFQQGLLSNIEIVQFATCLL